MEAALVLGLIVVVGLLVKVHKQNNQAPTEQGNHKIRNVAFGGKEFSGRVAEHIGISQNLFETALLEVGISRTNLNSYDMNGYSIEDTTRQLLPALHQGLEILRSKFGDQDQIVVATNKITNLAGNIDTRNHQHDDYFEEPTMSLRILSMQLSMASSNVEIFEHDNYSLGYLFGSAEMEYHIKGGDLNEQSKTLNFILKAIAAVNEDNYETLFNNCISLQKDAAFTKGRDDGVFEVSEFSEGPKKEYKPYRLMIHLNEMKRS